MSFSIYDIISKKRSAIMEAEDDNASDSVANDDFGNFDDDFSIDTSLDDGSSPEEDKAAAQDENPDAGAEQSGNDDMSSDNPPNTSADGGAEAEGEMSEEEEVEANTDIFSSLTAEEQAVKIKELKSLYSNLFSSIDDILERINKLDINEDNLETISRVSTSLYDMKVYISDYLTLVFPTKSYIENDVTFSRFLSIVKSITGILDDIAKKYTKENEEKDNYSKD